MQGEGVDGVIGIRLPAPGQGRGELAGAFPRVLNEVLVGGEVTATSARVVVPVGVQVGNRVVTNEREALGSILQE